MLDEKQPFRTTPVQLTTMRRSPTLLVGCLGAALMCTGCPHNVHTKLPSKPSDPTGTITILLTRPASDLTVSVNGTLVASRAHTRRVRVSGVPIGETDVVIAAGAGGQKVERHVRVDVEEDKQHTIPLASPERSWLSTAAAAVISIGAWFASQALYVAVF